jgi:hypothetical protein
MIYATPLTGRINWWRLVVVVVVVARELLSHKTKRKIK